MSIGPGGSSMRTWALGIGFVCSLGLAVSAVAYDPLAGDFSKEYPGDIRILSWNVLNNFPSGAAPEDEAFDRILAALQPDVICFQEIDSSLGEAPVEQRLDNLLGGTWEAHRGLFWAGGDRNQLAARWPLEMEREDTDPASEIRGVTIGLVDLPDLIYPRDIYLMGVHLKAGTGPDNRERRSQSGDAIAAWLGDARTLGGAVSLALDTPMVVLGDFNFYDSPAEPAEFAILNGDISDEVTYGPDVKGDWDNSDLADRTPLDPYNGSANTHSTQGAFDARFDRFYYTDSVVQAPVAFVLNTATMSPAQRAAAGLQAGDSSTATDHAAIVMDLRLLDFPAVESIVRLDTSPTTEGLVRFRVTFDQAVDDLGADDLSLLAGDLTGAAIDGVDGENDIWDVAVLTGMLEATTGSLALNLVDDDSVLNLGGMPLGGEGSGNGSAPGPAYIVRRPPTATHVWRRYE